MSNSELNRFSSHLCRTKNHWSQQHHHAENNCLYVAWASGFHIYEHILTEGRKYETLLKESYAVALDSCWVLTENVFNGIEHDADSAYGVCIHYRHFWNFLHILMDTS